MALVRCPKHNVPYNDENPRGCPACWQEREGGEQVTVMRELARASKGVPRVEILPPPEPEIAPPTERGSGPWPPVTPPPRMPVPEPTAGEKLMGFLQAHALTATAVVLGIVGVVLIYFLTRPTFERTYLPAQIAGDALPFPVEPNTQLLGAFALLGAVAPQVNPDSPSLARYDFGHGAVVDALNGVVYAVTLTSPDRSWNGNRVGLDETPARGHLALLGPVSTRESDAGAAFPMGGYLAYRSLAALPRRTLTADVRPPNGCYDVQVVLAPQVIGYSRSDERAVAVARRGGTPTWLVHQVRVVSRALAGPYAGPPVC